MLKLYVKAQALLQSLKDESGQDMIEYAIVAGIITAGACTAIGTVGGLVTSVWEALQGTLTTALTRG